MIKTIKKTIKQMKCLSYNFEKKTYELIKTDIPKPSSNETLLKIKAICINRVDILQKKGFLKSSNPENIFGLEFVGQKINENLEIIDNKIYGGIVFGGTYAEYVKINSKHLIEFNYDKDIVMKAGIPEAFLTAYQLIKYYSNLENYKKDIQNTQNKTEKKPENNLKPNKENNPEEESYIYIPAASSGVGTSLIQILKTLYNCKIIGSASSKKLDLLKTLKVDLILDYKSLSEKEMTSKIMAFTKNKGVNCIFDCIGPSKSKFHLKILSLDSNWVLYGLLGGNKLDNLNIMNEILFKRISLVGSLLKNRSDFYKEQLVGQFCTELMPFFGRGEIEPVIGEVLELDFLGDAVGVIEKAQGIMENNANFGRIVVKYI